MLQKLKRNYINASLKNKLLISYGMLLLVIVLAIGVSSYVIMKNYILMETYNKVKYSLIQVMNNIDYRFNLYDKILDNVVWDKNLSFSLNNQYSSPADYSYEYLTNISKAFAIKDNNFSEGIFEVILYKKNESIPNDGKTLLDMDYAAKRPWYRKYMEVINDGSIMSVINLINTNVWEAYSELPDTMKGYGIDKYVSIVKPVIHAGEQVVGLIEVFIKYDAIFDSDILNAEIMGGELSIVNNDGYIVYHNTQPQLVGSKSKEVIDGGYYKEGIKVNEEKGTLILNTVSPNSKWNYSVKIPIKALMADSQMILNLSLTIAFLSIIVSAFLSSLIAQIISSRLSKLSLKMQSINNLDFPLDVELDGEDEIGILSRNYSNMLSRIRQLVLQLHDDEKKIRDAEMKALQAQINPHFLYNTLATISWMALDKETDSIVKMVDNLSTFYRLSLNKGREFIKIEDEVTLVKAYCQIQKVRMGNKINMVYRFEQEILDYYIPKLILQPFVENAILHGTQFKNGITNIIVEAYTIGNDIVFKIIDDGVGTNKAANSEKNVKAGYGIKNVKDKIALQYGSDYGVQIFSRPGIGTSVSIKVPIMLEDPN